MDMKKVLKGGIATTAMACLLSFGVAAQTSGSASSDQNSSSTSSDQGTSTKHHKSASSQSASSDSSSSGQLAGADKTFVMKAAQGGLAEVQLGQLAADKGQSDQVKKFGQKMVDDHTKANDQLKSIAQQKGVQIPTDLDAKDKALKDKLSGLSGAQFDKMYMQHMVQDHKKDVAEFQKEANSGKDQDVKNFAQQTLPTLQEHLKLAQQANQSTAKSGSDKSSTTASNQQH
jgi:putative membrane protein